MTKEENYALNERFFEWVGERYPGPIKRVEIYEGGELHPKFDTITNDATEYAEIFKHYHIELARVKKESKTH
jgi:hypothetical protein